MIIRLYDKLYWRGCFVKRVGVQEIKEKTDDEALSYFFWKTSNRRKESTVHNLVHFLSFHFFPHLYIYCVFLTVKPSIFKKKTSIPLNVLKSLPPRRCAHWDRLSSMGGDQKLIICVKMAWSNLPGRDCGDEYLLNTL